MILELRPTGFRVLPFAPVEILRAIRASLLALAKALTPGGWRDHGLGRIALGWASLRAGGWALNPRAGFS